MSASLSLLYLGVMSGHLLEFSFLSVSFVSLPGKQAIYWLSSSQTTNILILLCIPFRRFWMVTLGARDFSCADAG